MTLDLPSKKIFVLRSISCPSSLFLSCLTSLSLFYPSCLTFPFIPYISLTILSIVPYCSFHSLRHSHHSIRCTLLFLSCLMSLTILSIVPYCSLYHALRLSHNSVHPALLFLSCLTSLSPFYPLCLTVPIMPCHTYCAFVPLRHIILKTVPSKHRSYRQRTDFFTSSG